MMEVEYEIVRNEGIYFRVTIDKNKTDAFVSKEQVRMFYEGSNKNAIRRVVTDTASRNGIALDKSVLKKKIPAKQKTGLSKRVKINTPAPFSALPEK